MEGGEGMKAFERRDVKGAWVVVSGNEVYDVYLGSDVSLPRCSCAAATYKDAHCKHQKLCEAQ